jgi:murein DD-endopeptidase MepM/ murein hydrolase activator NlpD
MHTPPIVYRISWSPAWWEECRADRRIVIRAMRRAAFIALLSAACTRPMLYYPASAAGPIAAAPDTVKTPSKTPSLMTVGNVALSDDQYLRERAIVMPVAGADITRVTDSFYEPRDGDRVHRAIDILAPRGTPILSADDGWILRMSTNQLGGISMYTVDSQSRLVYYYAHMERYNDAMTPGRAIARGDTLGYVGTTGNAPKNLPHLHFQVMRWPSDGKYWVGEPINPFTALGGVERRRD